MRRVGREACSSLTRRHLTDTAALDQPAAPGSAVIFFSSSAAENMTSDPVCPDFASAEADVVLRTADVSDHSYWSAGKQLPTLFRVKRNFLAMVSPVFRDMFAVCATEEASKAGAVERAVIELEEGAWEIRFMLLAHDEDIARHPDVNRVSGRMMVVLMELAVKYGLSMWQKSLETILQYRLPMYGSTEVAEVLSWALRHQRRAVIMAAVDRIVDLPRREWPLKELQAMGEPMASMFRAFNRKLDHIYAAVQEAGRLPNAQKHEGIRDIRNAF